MPDQADGLLTTLRSVAPECQRLGGCRSSRRGALRAREKQRLCPLSQDGQAFLIRALYGPGTMPTAGQHATTKKWASD
jgi:hypothetical protein